MPTRAKTNHPFAIITLLLSALAVLPVNAESFNDWYQVEVIIFANQSPTPTDEIWPLSPLRYPANMISIAPDSPDDYAPLSLGQAEELRAFNSLFGEAGVNTVETQPQNEFLFENRSRVQVIRPAATPSPTVENDTEGEATTVIDYDSLFDIKLPTPYQALPESRQMLNGLARSIRRSSLYETLVHVSWLQPVVNEAEALPVLFQAGEHHDDWFELDGTITISRSRFLHVNTDLWYTEFTPLYDANDMGTQNTLSRISPEFRTQYPELAAWEADRGQYTTIHTHQLKQSRRMRSSTLHFIDHPRFGILIRVEGFEWEPAD